MATFKEALDYAAKNPNSEFATAFGREVATGKHDTEARSLGFDTTPIKQKYAQPIQTSQPQEKEKESFIEKVAGFTGGKQLAQGLGQVIANPKIAKEQEQLLNDNISQQAEILKRKKEISELGGDTSAIDRALAINAQNREELVGGMEQLLNQKDLTGKQVIGSALQLGGTIVGAGTVGSGAGAVSKATTAGQGALAGLKAGATSGAIYGGTSGVATGLQEDGSATEIAQKGVTGALGGAVLGGALGAATGGITGKIKGKKTAALAKKQEFVEDLVMPKTTPELIEQARKTPGRIKEMGVLGQEKILPSTIDKQNAEIVKDIVSPKFTPQKNIDVIGAEVDKITEGVRRYVTANKVPFNTKQLATQLNKGKGELNLIFASDKQAEKTYNAVVKEFMKHVDSKDTSGLLDARQDFDKIPAIKKLIESQGLGENTKREIVKQVRRSANEYISSLLPEGNKYKESLLSQTRMIDIIDNIIEKNNDRIGRNKIQYLVKKYPWLKAAAWGTLIASGLGGSIGAIGAATGKGE